MEVSLNLKFNWIQKFPPIRRKGGGPEQSNGGVVIMAQLTILNIFPNRNKK